jgi:integrase
MRTSRNPEPTSTMAVRKIRNSWWVDFRWQNMRHRKRSPVNTRAGAAEYELVLREKLLRGQPLDVAPASEPAVVNRNMRFSEFAEHWFTTYVVTNNKPSEQHAKRCALRAHLVPWFGTYLLSAITSQHVEQFKSWQIERGFVAKTVNNHVAILRRCLRCAEDWGYLAPTPNIQLLRVGPPPFKVLARDECDRLLADASEPKWNRMIHIALRTGLRRGELMALDWSDIDFARNRLNVRRAVSDGIITSPKTYRHRTVPLSADLRAVLERDTRPSGLVCPNVGGAIWSDAAFARAIVRIARRAGIRPIGWHTLRHTFATELAAAGVPLHIVKELLGHASITMTMRYAHVAPSMLDDAIRSLERSASIQTYPKFGQPVGNTCDLPAKFDRSSFAVAA